MMSSPAIACYKHGDTPDVVTWCLYGTVESCSPWVYQIRFITASNDSHSGSYDGDTMAGSSCKREQ